MSTVQGMIDQVRRVLLGGYRPQFNLLTDAIDADDSPINVTYDAGQSGVGRGSYLSIDTEVLYVWSASSNSITVQRGMLGTTAASHSAGALIEVNPRFPNAVIVDEMRAEITSWPRSIYQVDAVTLSVGSDSSVVNLTGVSGLIDVLRVYRAPVTSTVTNDRWPDVPYKVQRNMATDRFASATALALDHVGITNTGFDIRVIYSKMFTTATFATTTDLQATVGLNDSLEDALKYGVCWRVLTGREVKRAFTEAQTEPRFAEEVPAGLSMQTANQFLTIRNKRLTDEATRLNGLYAWRMTR